MIVSNLMVGLKWPPDTSAVTRMPSCKKYAKHLAYVYVAKQNAFTFATLPLDLVQPPKRLEDVILNRSQPSRTRSLCWWRQTQLSQSTPPQIPWWIEVIEWINEVHIMHIVHVMLFWWMAQRSPGSPSLQVFVHFQKATAMSRFSRNYIPKPEGPFLRFKIKWLLRNSVVSQDALSGVNACW